MDGWRVLRAVFFFAVLSGMAAMAASMQVPARAGEGGAGGEGAAPSWDGARALLETPLIQGDEPGALVAFYWRSARETDAASPLAARLATHLAAGHDPAGFADPAAGMDEAAALLDDEKRSPAARFAAARWFAAQLDAAGRGVEARDTRADWGAPARRWASGPHGEGRAGAWLRAWPPEYTAVSWREWNESPRPAGPDTEGAVYFRSPFELSAARQAGELRLWLDLPGAARLWLDGKPLAVLDRFGDFLPGLVFVELPSLAEGRHELLLASVALEYSRPGSNGGVEDGYKNENGAGDQPDDGASAPPPPAISRRPGESASLPCRFRFDGHFDGHGDEHEGVHALGDGFDAPLLSAGGVGHWYILDADGLPDRALSWSESLPDTPAPKIAGRSLRADTSGGAANAGGAGAGGAGGGAVGAIRAEETEVFLRAAFEGGKADAVSAWAAWLGADGRVGEAAAVISPLRSDPGHAAAAWVHDRYARFVDADKDRGEIARAHESAEAWRRARECDSGWIAAWRALARAARAREDWRAAALALEAAVVHSPGHPGLYADRIDLALAEGRRAEARALLNEMRENNSAATTTPSASSPSLASTALDVADATAAPDTTGMPGMPVASPDTSDLSGSSGGSESLLSVRAAFAVARAHNDRAAMADAARRGARIEPWRAAWHFARARAAWDAGDDAEAQTAMRAAYERFAGIAQTMDAVQSGADAKADAGANAGALAHGAALWAARETWNEAEAWMTRSLAICPDAAGWRRLGEWRLRRGDAAAAAEAWTRALRIAPGDETLRGRLARLRKTRAISAAPASSISSARVGDVSAAGRLADPLAPADDALDEYRMDWRSLVDDARESAGAAHIVRIVDQEVVTVRADGRGRRAGHEVDLALSEDGARFLAAAPAPEGHLEAGTWLPDGSRMEPVAAAPAAAASAARRPGRTVAMPGMGSGATREWSWRVDWKPDAGGRWRLHPWFFRAPADERSFLWSDYVLRVPNGLPLAWTLRNAGDAVEFSESSDVDGGRVLRWTARRQAPPSIEAGAAPVGEWLPYLRVGSPADWPALAAKGAEEWLGRVRPTPFLREIARHHPPDADPAALRRLKLWVLREIQPSRRPDWSAARMVEERRGERAVALLAILRAGGWDAELVAMRGGEATTPLADWEIARLEDFPERLVRVRPPTRAPGDAPPPAVYIDVRDPDEVAAEERRGAFVISLGGGPDTPGAAPANDFSDPGPERLPGRPWSEFELASVMVLDLPARSATDGTVGIRARRAWGAAVAEGRREREAEAGAREWTGVVEREWGAVLPGLRVTAVSDSGVDAPATSLGAGAVAGDGVARAGAGKEVPGAEAGRRHHERYSAEWRDAAVKLADGGLALRLPWETPGLLRPLGALWPDERLSPYHLRRAVAGRDRCVARLPAGGVWTGAPAGATLVSRFGVYRLWTRAREDGGLSVERVYEFAPQRIQPEDWAEFLSLARRIEELESTPLSWRFAEGAAKTEAEKAP